MLAYLFILGYLIIYLSLFDYFILGYFNSFIFLGVFNTSCYHETLWWAFNYLKKYYVLRNKITIITGICQFTCHSVISMHTDY